MALSVETRSAPLHGTHNDTDARQYQRSEAPSIRRDAAVRAPGIGAQFATAMRARDPGRASRAGVVLAGIADGVSVIGCHRALVASAPEGAENASQQVRGCAAGTLTGREPACALPPITSRHLHG